MPAERLTVANLAAFGSAARVYWCDVFPRVRAELARWRVRAHEISDPRVRSLALRALAKRSNMEGAAAFATFAPAHRRAAVVRAAVAFQSAYNYLDLLAEQPCEQGVLNARALHEALPAALERDAGAGAGAGAQARIADCYAHLGALDDGGYLDAIVRTCQAAAASLPSYDQVRPAALAAAQRVACFQSFNCGQGQGDHLALECWAREQAPIGSGLAWWELAGSAGSSLGVHVMFAAAAQESLAAGEAAAIERAYFPWIGALHSILDQLIDTAEDALTGQANLVGYYEGPEQAARRIGWLAHRAVQSARALTPRPGRRKAREASGLAGRHELIVIAMASLYLSSRAASAPAARAAREAVLAELGPLAWAAIGIFAAARVADGVSVDADACGCVVEMAHDTEWSSLKVPVAGMPLEIPVAESERKESAIARAAPLCEVAVAD